MWATRSDLESFRQQLAEERQKYLKLRSRSPVKPSPPLRKEVVKRDIGGGTSPKVTGAATPDPDVLFDGEQRLSGKREGGVPDLVHGVRRRKSRAMVEGVSPEVLDPDNPHGVLEISGLGRFLLPVEDDKERDFANSYGC